MITADQLKDVMDRADALHRYLNIDQKKVEFEEEQLRTQAPDFWEDPKYAQEQMKKVKGIQKWLDGYKTVRLYADELKLAFDFYKDEMVTEEEVDRGQRYGEPCHTAPVRPQRGSESAHHLSYIESAARCCWHRMAQQ